MSTSAITGIAGFCPLSSADKSSPRARRHVAPRRALCAGGALAPRDGADEPGGFEFDGRVFEQVEDAALRNTGFAGQQLRNSLQGLRLLQKRLQKGRCFVIQELCLARERTVGHPTIAEGLEQGAGSGLKQQQSGSLEG